MLRLVNVLEIWEVMFFGVVILKVCLVFIELLYLEIGVGGGVIGFLVLCGIVRVGGLGLDLLLLVFGLMGFNWIFMVVIIWCIY